MSDKTGHPSGTANICWYCDIEIDPATHQCPRFREAAPLPAMALKEYIEKLPQVESELRRTKDELAEVYTLFGIGKNNHNLAVLKICFDNQSRFAEMLHAIEREFFMIETPPEPEDDGIPGEECLLNCWGSTIPEYVEQFRKAIPHLQADALTAATAKIEALTARWTPITAETLPSGEIKQVFCFDSDTKTVHCCEFPSGWNSMLAHSYLTHWMPVTFPAPLSDKGEPQQPDKAECKCECSLHEHSVCNAYVDHADAELNGCGGTVDCECAEGPHICGHDRACHAQSSSGDARLAAIDKLFLHGDPKSPEPKGLHSMVDGAEDG